MRTAYFLLPYNPDFDIRRQSAHQHVRARLLEAFNGFTTSLVEGAWRDPEGKVHFDHSVKYEVAMEWERYGDILLFEHIAREGGALQPQWQKDGKAGPAQECVMVSDPWGYVTMPDCNVKVPAGYCHKRI